MYYNKSLHNTINGPLLQYGWRGKKMPHLIYKLVPSTIQTSGKYTMPIYLKMSFFFHRIPVGFGAHWDGKI